MDADLNQVLTNVLGLTNAQVTKLEAEEIVDAIEIAGTAIKDILDCFKGQQKLKAAQKAKLTAFKAWVDDQRKVVGDDNIDVLGFDDDTMKRWRYKTNASDKAETKSEATSTTIDVGKFDGNDAGWLKEKDKFIAKLFQMKNKDGIPIYYVIRDLKDEAKIRTQFGDIGDRIYDAPHTGERFHEDSLTLLQKVRDWCYGGSAKAYILENEDNVQQAWANLLAQYE